MQKIKHTKKSLDDMLALVVAVAADRDALKQDANAVSSAGNTIKD